MNEKYSLTKIFRLNLTSVIKREDDSLKRKGIWKRGVVVSGIMLAMNCPGAVFFVKKIRETQTFNQYGRKVKMRIKQ